MQGKNRKKAGEKQEVGGGEGFGAGRGLAGAGGERRGGRGGRGAAGPEIEAAGAGGERRGGRGEHGAAGPVIEAAGAGEGVADGGRLRVEVRCVGAGLARLDDLEPFQGSLKSLSEANYQRLRKQIVEQGFSEPFCVWRHEGKCKVLNGHQRRTALLRLRDAEGYVVPDLPVVWVDAKDLREARRKVLALTSQYGDFEEDGLREFLSLAELSAEEAQEDYRLPEVDWSAVLAEDLEDGVSGESNPSEDPADTGFTFGDLRFKVKRAAFQKWEEDLRQKAGFDKESMLKEVKRRLKL